jgi:hypothetical protein
VLYLLLHYAVVCWLTFYLLSGIGALSLELVQIGPVTVRLWWLVAALIIAVALGAHAAILTEPARHDEEFLFGACLIAGLAHIPAVFGAWGLVWTGPFGHGIGFLGHVVAALLSSVLFLALLGGSCVGIAWAMFTWADDRAERHDALVRRLARV